MSITITYTLGSRGVASFQTSDLRRDTANAYRPDTDQSVVIKNETDTVTLFSGTSLEVSDQPGIEPNIGVVSPVKATDYTRACDARIVNATFAAGQTKKQVVSALRTSYLDAFGITLDAAMTNGAALPELTFGNVKLTEALNRIATITGDIWRITPGKVLQMEAPGTWTASYSLTSTNGKILGGPKWQKTLRQKVNRVFLEYGSERQVEKTQAFAASSVGQTYWVLDYPGVGANLRGYITLNAAYTPIGPGTAWTWDAANNRIVRSPASAGGEVVSVTYDAQFPTTVVRPDTPPAEPWEARLTAPDVFDKTTAIAMADGLLARYTAAAAARVVTIRTREGLVLPGDVITITVPERVLSGSWLITAVTIRTEADHAFTYDLTCVEGTDHPDSWQDTTRNLLGGNGSSGGTIIGGAIPGTAGVTGGGTTGTVPKFATGNSLTDSIISESGTVATVAGTLALTGSSLSIAGETITSGTGSPEGVVTATPGSLYLQDNGAFWTKATGAGNTGWTSGSGVTGSGTANTLTKWTGTSALGNASITDDGATVTVAPTGDLVLNPGGNDVLPDANYDINLGTIAKKYLTLHAAELWVETLVAQDTIATIGGSIIVAPTTVLVQDVGVSDTSIHVKHNEIQNGDRVLLKADGKLEPMSVTSAASGTEGNFTYSVTRLSAGGISERIETASAEIILTADGDEIWTSPSAGAHAWYAGDAVVNIGTTGDGFMDIYSLHGVNAGTEYGPTIVGNVRLSATWNDWAPRFALGNLNGLYGYSGNTYGAAFGEAAGAWVKIDPTNGVRIGHNATTFAQITAAGSASFTGSISITGGSGFANLSDKPTSLAGINSGEGTKLSGIAAGATVGATWGTNLASIPVRFADSPGAAGLYLTATYMGYWDGAAWPVYIKSDGTAVFSGTVYASAGSFTGAVTATSGSFTGAVTASSGSIGGFTIGATTISATNLTLTSGAAGTAHLLVGTGSTAAGLNSADSGTSIAIWAGSSFANRGSAAFRVTAAGALTATSATVSGDITASNLDANDGTLANLDIDGTLTIASGGSLVAGDTTLNGDGITLQSGIYLANKVKWSDGSYISSVDDSMLLSCSNLTIPGSVHFTSLSGNTGTALVIDGSGYLYYSSSSRRFKDNIERFALDDPASALRIHPTRFDYTSGARGVVGFVAEELAAISPDLVNVDGDGSPFSTRTDALLVYLLEAIRHLYRLTGHGAEVAP